MTDESDLNRTPLPQFTAASQSPMPGWLHWLESTAIPSTPSVFSPTLTPTSSVSDDHASTGSSLLHDARSMVTALGLYCDLLAEPGVLTAAFRHYADELRLVAGSSRRLLDQLQLQIEDPTSNRLTSGFTAQPELPLGPRLVAARPAHTGPAGAGRGDADRSMIPNSIRPIPLREPVTSLADELMAMRNLLAALAGPAITLGLSLDGGYRPVALATDDLTRILVNLVRNAADAMPEGGHIQVTVREMTRPEEAGNDRAEKKSAGKAMAGNSGIAHSGLLRLTVTDTGCGLSDGDLDAIFAPGYSTHINLDTSTGSEDASHRGMGLAIVRSLVAAAGGSIHAANRPSLPADADEESSTGAVFTLDFPLAE